MEKRITTPEEDASYQRMIQLEMERQASFQSECNDAFIARDDRQHRRHKLFLNENQLNELHKLPEGDTTTSVDMRCSGCGKTTTAYKGWEYCPHCGTRFDEMIRLHVRMLN